MDSWTYIYLYPRFSFSLSLFFIRNYLLSRSFRFLKACTLTGHSVFIVQELRLLVILWLLRFSKCTILVLETQGRWHPLFSTVWERWDRGITCLFIFLNLWSVLNINEPQAYCLSFQLRQEFPKRAKPKGLKKRSPLVLLSCGACTESRVQGHRPTVI